VPDVWKRHAKLQRARSSRDSDGAVPVAARTVIARSRVPRGFEGMLMDTTRSADQLTHMLESAFAPLHKRALGIATGLTAGLAVLLVTSFHVLARPENGPPIQLLSQYLYGYEVSWRGALVGLWWGFVVGFVAGWFLAFVRNVALATWIFIVRTKAELEQTRDFLDHI
jgi:hypothetical protein